MQTTLLNALGDLARWPRFFVWRLTDWTGKKFDTKWPWNGADKFDAKQACLTGRLHSYADAVAQLTAFQSVNTNPAVVYSLGWYFMPDAGYWFVDIDGNIDGPTAQRAWSALGAAGTFFEYSSSGNGLHFIGRGQMPPHKTRGEGLPDDMEIYSTERGICFGLSATAYGCADTAVMPPAEWIIHHAPTTTDNLAGLIGGKRMPEWRGPEDDDELIQRMLARREAATMLRGGVTFRQLWEGDDAAICARWPHETTAKDRTRCTDADGALASHLAWWTGADQERMTRLMWRSGLVRDKWSEHRTYLQITTGSAITELLSRGRSCYVQQEQRIVLPPLPMLAPAADAEPHRGVPAAMEIITKVGSPDELKAAAARITAMGPWDAPDIETIAARIKRKSAELNSTWPIALCKRLVDGTAPDPNGTGVPDWLEEWAFIATQNKYCHIAGDFDLMGRDALHVALYSKPEIPVKSSGEKEDAAKMLNMWGVQVVSDTGYSPREGLTYREGGRVLLNKFINSMPDTQDGGSTEAIAIYQQHLWNLCDHHQENYNALLNFMAHVVQHPGKLIRWAPLVIGAHGTGKTAFSMPLAHAMGKRNVKFAAAGGVNNGGGFMDWVASEHCLGIINDFHISGPDKFTNRDAIKPVISDDMVAITRKGRVDTTYTNYASYIMSTNQREPLPLERTERRWFILTTTWLDRMVTERPVEAAEYFRRLEWATKHALTPGQWRAFFESIPLQPISAVAPITAAFRAIVGNSINEATQAIAECIEGFDVVTTNKITEALRGIDGAPSTKALTKTMNSFGFDYYDKSRLTVHGGNKTGIYIRSAKISANSAPLEQVKELAQQFIRAKDAALFDRRDLT